MSLGKRKQGLLVVALCFTTTLAPESLPAQSALPRIFAWAETLPEPEGSELVSPVAVVPISNNQLAVAEAVPSPRLHLYVRRGAAWARETTVPLPASPIGLAHLGGRVVVALRQAGGLVSYEAAERGLRPVPVSREVVPGGLAVSASGRLLVHDVAGDRVLELASGGQVARQTAVPRGVTEIAAIADGGFIVAMAAEARLVRFDDEWVEAGSWGLESEEGVPAWPVALDVLPNGEILVLDRHQGRVLALDANGRRIGQGSRRGWEDGLLWYPADLATLPNGGLVVADQGNGRVQIFRRAARAGG